MKHNFKSLTNETFLQHWLPCARQDLSTEDQDAIWHAKLVLVRNIVCPLHPVREKQAKHLRSKWFSTDLLRLRTEGRRLQRTWLKSKNSTDQSRYLKHLQYYKLAIKQGKKKYVQGQINSAQSSSKALFKVSQELAATKSSHLFQPADPLQYCESVASFFEQKVLKIREEVERESPSPEAKEAWQTFQQWKEERQRTTESSNSDHHSTEPSSSSSPPPFAEFTTATLNEVKQALRKCRPSSSSLDPIPTSTLCELDESVILEITAIVNSSLSTGSVPAAWKKGLVTPLPKKPGADMEVFSNLRPVTQLRILPRVTEAIATAQLQNHVEKNLLLHDLQSGFRPGRGTELATADIRERLLWCTDRSHPALLILLDLSAAFDTVDHTILLQRLEHIAGVQGTALAWFEAFLRDRTQAVKWGETSSSFRPVRQGVPQGSSLSPVLFNIYMRPLASILEQSGLKFQMYADDTQILVDLHESTQEKERLVPCLALIKDWMRENKLRLNSSKTELLLLKGHRNEPETEVPWPPSWGPQPTLVEHTKNLGLVFSHHLDGAAHAAATVKSCHFQLNSLARLFPLLTLSQKKCLYQAAVGSRINYGLALMLGATEKTIYTLQKIQNRAIRLIFGLTRRDHISTWRSKLKWLSVKDQITLKIGVWMWKACHHLGPRYSFHWAQHLTTSRNRRPQLSHQLAIPKIRKTKRGGATIAWKGSKLWNMLPTALKLCSSLPQFKQNLKNHLLQQASLALIPPRGAVIGKPPPRSTPLSASTSEELRQIADSIQTSLPTTTQPSLRSLSQSNNPLTLGLTIRGLSSPPLPQRNNEYLIQMARDNKKANTNAQGFYAPRRI